MIMKLGKMASPEFSNAMKNLIGIRGFSGQISYRIRKIAKHISEEAQTFEESRKAIISEFADKDEKGEIIIQKIANQEIVKIAPEKLKDANKKIGELGNTEIEVESLKISELGECVKSLTPEDLLYLDFITE